MVEPESTRPIELEDLFLLKTLTEAQLSPRGDKAVYTLSQIDVEKEAVTPTCGYFAPGKEKTVNSPSTPPGAARLDGPLRAQSHQTGVNSQIEILIISSNTSFTGGLND